MNQGTTTDFNVIISGMSSNADLSTMSNNHVGTNNDGWVHANAGSPFNGIMQGMASPLGINQAIGTAQTFSSIRLNNIDTAVATVVKFTAVTSHTGIQYTWSIRGGGKN